MQGLYRAYIVVFMLILYSCINAISMGSRHTVSCHGCKLVSCKACMVVTCLEHWLVVVSSAAKCLPIGHGTPCRHSSRLQCEYTIKVFRVFRAQDLAAGGIVMLSAGLLKSSHFG